MFFNHTIIIRIRKADIKLVHKIIKLNKNKYENESHFVRCATLKLIRKEIRMLKLK